MSLDEAPRQEKTIGEFQLASLFDQKLRDMQHTPKKVVAQLLLIELKLDGKYAPEDLEKIWVRNLEVLRGAYQNELKNPTEREKVEN